MMVLLVGLLVAIGVLGAIKGLRHRRRCRPSPGLEKARPETLQQLEQQLMDALMQASKGRELEPWEKDPVNVLQARCWMAAAIRRRDTTVYRPE